MKQVVLSFGLLIIAISILVWLAQVDHFYTKAVDDVWIVIFSLSILIVGLFSGKKGRKRSRNIVHHHHNNINYGQLLKAGISRREGDILSLIYEGLSNQQIAHRLFISESTVKKHISNLLQKLKVDCRTDSIIKAKELLILM